MKEKKEYPMSFVPSGNARQRRKERRRMNREYPAQFGVMLGFTFLK